MTMTILTHEQLIRLNVQRVLKSRKGTETFQATAKRIGLTHGETLMAYAEHRGCRNY